MQLQSQFQIVCVKQLKFVGDFESFFLKIFILCLGFFKMILKTIILIYPIENSITILALFLVPQRNDIANPFLCQHLLRLISRPHCKPFCLVVEHIFNFAPLLTHIELPIFNFRMPFYCAIKQWHSCILRGILLQLNNSKYLYVTICIIGNHQKPA